MNNRLAFAKEMLRRFSNIESTLISDYANLNLSVLAEEQNYRYGSGKNLKLKLQRPLNSPIVTDREAMFRIICSYFVGQRGL